jgi:hypothetical protein
VAIVEAGDPFIDPGSYRRWVEKSEEAFKRQLEAQRQP